MNLSEMRAQAEAGSAVSQCVLGLTYLNGIEVEVNYAEALRWLSAAASQNVSRAALNLGVMYAKGLGVAQNQAEAIRLLEAVAKPDQSSDAFAARIELGRIYARQGPTGEKRAREWYSAALAVAPPDASADDVAEARRNSR